MPKIITHGATLHCTLGVKESNLMVTSQTFRRIANTLVVTEGDNKGIVNIPSFGVCKCNSPQILRVTPHESGSKLLRKTVSMGMKMLNGADHSVCMLKEEEYHSLDTGSNSGF